MRDLARELEICETFRPVNDLSRSVIKKNMSLIRAVMGAMEEIQRVEKTLHPGHQSLGLTQALVILKQHLEAADAKEK